jgi:hypothetical protein
VSDCEFPALPADIHSQARLWRISERPQRTTLYSRAHARRQARRRTLTTTVCAPTPLTEVGLALDLGTPSMKGIEPMSELRVPVFVGATWYAFADTAPSARAATPIVRAPRRAPPWGCGGEHATHHGTRTKTDGSW